MTEQAPRAVDSDHAAPGVYDKADGTRVVVEPKAETARIIGGPYDGVRVGADLPDVILMGPRRVRYEAIADPDSGERLGGFVYAPDPCPDAERSQP